MFFTLNTLMRYPYPKNMTIVQNRMVAFCFCASAIRGALRARLMIAKERIPSRVLGKKAVGHRSAEVPERRVEWEEEVEQQAKHKNPTLTQRSYNLSLQPVLCLEPAGEIRNLALLVSYNIGNLANAVEHLPACKHQNEHKTYRRPDVAAFNNGQQIWRSDCDDSHQGDGGS